MTRSRDGGDGTVIRHPGEGRAVRHPGEGRAVRHPGEGRVIRHAGLRFRPEADSLVSQPVGPEIGARGVVLEVVRVPPGRRFVAAGSDLEENNAVVFAGSGSTDGPTGAVPVRRGSAVHAPTGVTFAIGADAGSELTVYLWRSHQPRQHPSGSAPKRIGSLWDDDTQLIGFTGYGGVEPGWVPATMNFVFWPGTGSAHLCLHCGIQRPGETFAVHIHPDSEEAFFAFEGTGQMYLADRWIDVEAGDILFAPPGVRHGTRKPPSASAGRFVTCGGPTPFDPVLYLRAGVSPDLR